MRSTSQSCAMNKCAGQEIRHRSTAGGPRPKESRQQDAATNVNSSRDPDRANSGRELTEEGAKAKAERRLREHGEKKSRNRTPPRMEKRRTRPSAARPNTVAARETRRSESLRRSRRSVWLRLSRRVM